MVMLGAMVAGWLTIRVLRPNPEGEHVGHPPRERVALPSSPVPETTHGTEHSVSTTGRTGGGEKQQAHRDQGLIALENALLRDHRIGELLFSYPGLMSFPSSITYRRTMDFWKPAFAGALRRGQ